MIMPSQHLSALRYICLFAAFVFVGCSRAPEPASALPPEEDVFVSYFQAAHGLADSLSKFKSKDDFAQDAKRLVLIDKLIEDLNDYLEKMKSLPGEERERLAEERADLVEKTRNACLSLEQMHVKNPEILGERWDRIWEGLQFGDFIESTSH